MGGAGRRNARWKRRALLLWLFRRGCCRRCNWRSCSRSCAIGQRTRDRVGTRSWRKVGARSLSGDEVPSLNSAVLDSPTIHADRGIGPVGIGAFGSPIRPVGVARARCFGTAGFWEATDSAQEPNIVDSGHGHICRGGPCCEHLVARRPSWYRDTCSLWFGTGAEFAIVDHQCHTDLALCGSCAPEANCLGGNGNRRPGWEQQHNYPERAQFHPAYRAVEVVGFAATAGRVWLAPATAAGAAVEEALVGVVVA